jgi:hypothetical protein
VLWGLLAQFTGGVVDDRFEGHGTFTFPDGVEYKGTFRNGQFHGAGTLRFPDGGTYEAVWDMGTELTGAYSFKDGLAYDPEESRLAEEGKNATAEAPTDGTAGAGESGWLYLAPGDRRFHSERQRVHIEPAGKGWLGDRGTAAVPEGTFDMGGGLHLDVTTDTVVETATGKALRKADDAEKAWVVSTCRHAVTAGVTLSARMEAPGAKQEVSPRAPGEASPRPAATT